MLLTCMLGRTLTNRCLLSTVELINLSTASAATSADGKNTKTIPKENQFMYIINTCITKNNQLTVAYLESPNLGKSRVIYTRGLTVDSRLQIETRPWRKHSRDSIISLPAYRDVRISLISCQIES